MAALQRSVTDVGMRAGPAGAQKQAQSRARRQSMPSGALLPIDARQRREGAAPAAAASKERLPARYQAQQAIGRGSYGCVWEAFDRDTGRLVAVKRVARLFRDSVDCKRILREISIMSKLSHPSIVRLHDVPPVSDVGSFDDLYIIMELCDADMNKLVRANVTLSPVHVTTLLYNLLLGLNYLHSAGIYHRDLKPANCLVNKDCSVKVCDFGLSRATGEPAGLPGEEAAAEGGEEAPRLRRALTNHVATRWYRAPELILLQEDYTEAVDVWSVGCIYAELLQMLEGCRMEDRGPLFPGSSCFPLSPDRRHRHDVRFHAVSKGSKDQLNVIFELLGTPPEAVVNSLQHEEAKRHIRACPVREGRGIRSRFPAAPEESVRLLERMLRFLPRDRVTVAGALEHPLLAEIRDPAKETSSHSLVNLAFDREADLNDGLLRKYFAEEIGRFHESSSLCQLL